MTGEQENCERLRELVGEYALGDQAEHSQDERAQVEEHLATCAGCREHVKQVRAIADALRSVSQVEVPQEVLFTTRSRVMAAVRSKLQALALEEEEGSFRRRRLLRRVLAGAAAVLLITASVVYWFTSGARHERGASGRLPEVAQTAPKADSSVPRPMEPLREAAPPPVVAKAPTSPKPTIEEAVRTAKDPKAALALLEVDFAKAKAPQQPDPGAFEELAVAAKALVTRWADSEEATKALELLSRCYTQMADPKRAQDAFLAYADALGAKVKAAALKGGLAESEAEAKARGETSTIILREAERLFDSSDYLAAASYSDVLVTRYPGAEPAWQAQVLLGHCHQRTRRPVQAVAAYRAVIREAPESQAALCARSSLPTALLNSGRKEEAVQAWLDYSRTAPSRDARANGVYNAGATLAFLGSKRYPEAMRMYKAVVEGYPDAPCAPVAKRALAKLEREFERGILGP